MADDIVSQTYEVVILGAGYAGLMAALRLGGRDRPGRVALVNDNAEFVERIRLQERLGGPVAPRLPPLPELLAGVGVDFICGRVAGLDPAKRQAEILGEAGPVRLGFGRCIYALGSRTDETAVRGAGLHAFRLDPGAGPFGATALARRLAETSAVGRRVVVVGGGNTAAEVAGEIKANSPQTGVTLVSAGRVGDFAKGAKVERLTRAELSRLGVELIDDSPVAEILAGEVVMVSGRRIAADVCVLAAGLRAPALARQAGLEVDDQDRLWVDPELRSISHPHILAVGDAAHPVAPCGAAYRMSAFAAVISGAYAANRLIAERAQRASRPFSFSAYGQGVAIGRGGVGFFTFPNDRKGFFVLHGRVAARIRSLFVWALVAFLKLERRRPGLLLFWIGRRRVSWREANAGMRSRSPGKARRGERSDATPRLAEDRLVRGARSL
jgi:NADH dehydrogenase